MREWEIEPGTSPQDAADVLLYQGWLIEDVLEWFAGKPNPDAVKGRIFVGPFNTERPYLDVVCECGRPPIYFAENSPSLADCVWIVRLELSPYADASGSRYYVWLGECKRCGRKYWSATGPRDAHCNPAAFYARDVTVCFIRQHGNPHPKHVEFVDIMEKFAIDRSEGIPCFFLFDPQVGYVEFLHEEEACLSVKRRILQLFSVSAENGGVFWERECSISQYSLANYRRDGVEMEKAVLAAMQQARFLPHVWHEVIEDKLDRRIIFRQRILPVDLLSPVEPRRIPPGYGRSLLWENYRDFISKASDDVLAAYGVSPRFLVKDI